MSTSKRIDLVCLAGVLLAILLTGFLLNAEAFGIETARAGMGYEDRLFDTSFVHTIDIVMDDWEGFLENCGDKEYASCAVVIDGETCKNAGIRAKGNNSLSSVASYGNDRYSFKVEFDHYESGRSCHGLDKLSLTSLIQDNTMMKDYLVYRLMDGFGVDAPLCSYAYITVNGEDWGLYLMTEGVEESFLRRNYGGDYGALYKPDSMNRGGGQTGGSGGDDVKLLYRGDDPESYPNIFENAKTDVSEADRRRLIASIRALNGETDLETVLNVDEILRYFVVHNFVCNFDSYTGQVVHNYYLYEEDGVLSMIPWDYNLAFGSFQSNAGATEIVNFPIDTPVTDNDLDNRPMAAWIFHDDACTERYHQYFSRFLSDYIDSGVLEEMIGETFRLIAPYVEKDPTKFCTYGEFETGVEVLREFCRLRARSVSGQLRGTIPSTAGGQEADSAALVDASAINLSDTGSMDGGQPEANGRDAPWDRGGRGDRALRPFEQTPPSGDSRGQSAGPGSKNPADSLTLYSVQGAGTASPQGLTEDASSRQPGDSTPPEDDSQQPAAGAEQPRDVPESGGSGGENPPPSDGQSGSPPGELPGFPGGPGEWNSSGEEPAGDTGADAAASWAALGISAAVLAFGLAFALLFRRR